MAEKIDFYFDFNSPYGYFAAEKIDALAAKYGREVAWKPVLLGAIFKVTGGAPLPMLPLKADYAKRDFPRAAKFHEVEFNFPVKFPFSPIAASRAVYWAEGKYGDARAHELGLALYRAALRDRKEIDTPESVAEIAAETGFDKEEVLAGLQDPAVKERLKQEVDGAIEKKAFGSPYIIIDGEPFWGSDRLAMVEKWLETGGW